MTTYYDGWTDVQPIGVPFFASKPVEIKVHHSATERYINWSPGTLFRPIEVPPPPRRKTAVDELEEALGAYEPKFEETVSRLESLGYAPGYCKLIRAADRVIREHREGKR